MRGCATGADDTAPPRPEDNPACRWFAEQAPGRMRSLGMPLDAPWAFIFTPDPIDAHRSTTPLAIVTGNPPRIEVWTSPTKQAAGQDLAGLDGYKIEFFGGLYDHRLETDGPHWVFTPDDRTSPMAIELWEMRAFMPDAPCFALSTWNPNEGPHHLIKFTGDTWPDAAAIAAKPALEWLREFKKVSRRGKKGGDGAIWPGGVPEFLDDLFTTLEGIQKRTGKTWGIDIRTRDFRMSMRGTPSPRQLYKFLNLAKIRRSEVEGGQVTRTNYVQFTAQRGP